MDIGATYVRVAVGDSEGITEKLIQPTETGEGPEGVSLQIISMIHELTNTPQAIGVGCIGPVDLAKGLITNTPNFPFNNIPVKAPLEAEFKVPVKMVNDCSAAVVGEHVYGAGKDTGNLFYVTLSTGLGGGAIVDGNLLLGKDGNAVEVGHMTLDPHSYVKCGCGSPGHWEAFCGGKNIPYYARKILRGGWRNSLLNDLTGGDLRNLSTKMIYDAAKQGDMAALNVVEAIGRMNAVGFANIVNVFDPDLITVGGSIALNNPELVLMPIEHFITEHVINRLPDIMVTPLGEDVVLLGALALAVTDRYL